VLIRGLVGRALDDLSDDRPPSDIPSDLLRVNLWRAARDGFAGSCLHPRTGQLVAVTDQLDDLLARIDPVLREHGDRDFVDRQFALLRESGGGAQRQRAAHARRGRLDDVVDFLADPTPDR
jgi:carboxylate-amine ligase